MQCRKCGTEIADKALICYRCGTATTEAKYKAPPARKPRSSVNLVSSVLALVLLVLVALYMQRFVTVGAPDDAAMADGRPCRGDRRASRDRPPDEALKRVDS